MNFKGGFQVGTFLDYELLKNLNLRPALQLTQKGYEAIEGNKEGPFYWYRNWSLTYLELPVDFIYNIPLSKTIGLYAGIGPVVGVGLFGSGKGIIKGTDSAGQIHTQEGAGHEPFKKPGFKNIDIGADFLAGLQLKRILLTASYNHGLLNALNYEHDIQTTRHRSFALSLGYIIRNH
jgi:hypothetical protein